MIINISLLPFHWYYYWLLIFNILISLLMPLRHIYYISHFIFWLIDYNIIIIFTLCHLHYIIIIYYYYWLHYYWYFLHFFFRLIIFSYSIIYWLVIDYFIIIISFIIIIILAIYYLFLLLLFNIYYIDYYFLISFPLIFIISHYYAISTDYIIMPWSYWYAAYYIWYAIIIIGFHIVLSLLTPSIIINITLHIVDYIFIISDYDFFISLVLLIRHYYYVIIIFFTFNYILLPLRHWGHLFSYCCHTRQYISLPALSASLPARHDRRFERHVTRRHIPCRHSPPWARCHARRRASLFLRLPARIGMARVEGRRWMLWHRSRLASPLCRHRVFLLMHIVFALIEMPRRWVVCAVICCPPHFSTPRHLVYQLCLFAASPLLSRSANESCYWYFIYW